MTLSKPRLLAAFTVWLTMLLTPCTPWAQSQVAPSSGEVTLFSQFWIDEGGKTNVEQLLVATPDPFQPLVKHRSFNLTPKSALWMRLDIPATDAKSRRYLQMTSGTFIDRASLFQRTADGQWTEQRAGDHTPVSQWDHPDQTPVFLINSATAQTVWLRLENQPAPIAPRLQLVSDNSLEKQHRWTFLLLGAYFGFGLLVLFLGVMHARLYADRAFVIYSAYVALMLLFQVAFTGIGGLYFWPHSAAWNNAAPAIFMFCMAAAGTWCIREVCALPRHSKSLDKFVMFFVVLGPVLSVFYTAINNFTTFILLNLYGLMTVLIGLFVCIWVWRRGERYGGWLLLGFLPIHLGYPFPALRSAGVIADNWVSQYSVLIGSAIEIPLLLYVLHMRAKEFNENRARMRVIDQTDPLTGLAMPPVLTFRIHDALRRAERQGIQHTLMLVELTNHADIVKQDGRPMGDRALVVAAARLLATVPDLNTVCRIDDARFAILVQNSQNTTAHITLAQSIVARGLAEAPDASSMQPLKFCVVTSLLESPVIVPGTSGEFELHHVLAPLVQAMNALVKEPKRTIVHLPPASPSPVPATPKPA